MCENRNLVSLRHENYVLKTVYKYLLHESFRITHFYRLFKTLYADGIFRLALPNGHHIEQEANRWNKRRSAIVSRFNIS